MKNFYKIVVLSIISGLIFSSSLCFSQENNSVLTEATFSGLKFRNIGPAFMSGRISDIAIHPDNDNIWYVTVGSGGVWKTNNAGVTWNPIFDNQKSYSIGCVTIDPNNPHIVWIGTGENVGGRHVGYGDGIYKSEDDGKTWKNLGLENSHHISKIIIHPSNSDIIWVAAQGPLWNKGEERGFYKTIDGGKTWKRTLGDNEWIGVTDMIIDPRNPDIIYAATWQRHRNVAAYMGGGPGTGIYKSKDGGETWIELTNGLPESNMGKIGLAISPQNPDIIYAAIELNRRTGGVYRSSDRGASWIKKSDAVSGATGPHYYQELYACPHKFDRIYLVDVRMQISDDGGQTFRVMKEKHKHSDNHAIAFRKNDPNYLLVGTDGGMYESFDYTKNWRYISNLPVTQFYKVAVDDAEPFYNIYGGTQDNNTQGGPSRTDNLHGISNADWDVVIFADGHQPATEPGNPDIMYGEWQQGNLVRVDRKTGELVYIQPQPAEGEDFERFNWDAPILVSPHSPTRIYHASQRLWQSDNRGDSWKAISGDLTKNQGRTKLPLMDKTWGWDSPWDLDAMSNYNTITSITESPIKEGLIYIGTDDGLIQVTDDGGQNWRKIEVSNLPGIPKTAFINDIKADLHNENTVYIVLDNHKFGDLNPYLYKSTDKGESWKSIKNNLPEKTLLWRIVQDHVKPELLFVATEFGVYFTINGGGKWIKLKAGMPTISIRDLAIQKRENDLVAASFGRGFFVLDDYSVLREISEEQLNKEAALFSTRKAWWYFERGVLGFMEKKGSQGAGYYLAPNPPFGAVFTYHLKDSYKTMKEIRQEKEAKLLKQNANVPFPEWNDIDTELQQGKPQIWLTIKDTEGNVVRRIDGPTTKGIHRVTWNLRHPLTLAITDKKGEDWFKPQGMMVVPGKYSVTLSKDIDGVITELADPVAFDVEQMYKGSLDGAEPLEAEKFRLELAEMQKKVSALHLILGNSIKKASKMKRALKQSKSVPGELDKELHTLIQDLNIIMTKLTGSKAKQLIGEKINPTVSSRMMTAYIGIASSSYGPTPTHKESLELANKMFNEIKTDFEKILNEQIPALEKKLLEAGAPWSGGQELPGE